MKRTKLISDKYRKSRGGRSKKLTLACEKCERVIFDYQKDGPGLLKRLYFDRIDNPKFIGSKELSCPKCKTLLGVKIIYKKENRLAYRLFAGSVIKI